jgi:ribosomal protein S18 acetylase RimI-like enzyme
VPSEDRAQIVEDTHVEWFAYLEGVPGLEVHCDPDITWKVSPGAAWANCGVRLRFGANVTERLDAILHRYREKERGAGFWVGPAATPRTLPGLLRARRVLCRKHYPAMYCDLTRLLPQPSARAPLAFSEVTDYSVFQREAHPSIGRITTRIRRFQLAVQQHLSERVPRRAWELMASIEGKSAGICTVYLGERHAGLFDVGVHEYLRGLGIGSALTAFACSFAQQRGAEAMILIASNAGYHMYERAGFEDVARFGFWYKARP